MTTATLDLRPAARPTLAAPGGTAKLVRLFDLDRLPEHRRQLVCHWRRGADGRLACVWDREIVVTPR